jgi:hypothetical protein
MFPNRFRKSAKVLIEGGTIITWAIRIPPESVTSQEWN